MSSRGLVKLERSRFHLAEAYALRKNPFRCFRARTLLQCKNFARRSVEGGYPTSDWIISSVHLREIRNKQFKDLNKAHDGKLMFE